jgi:hypothetical protein
MGILGRLSKIHTAVLIGSVIVDAYNTYKRLKMDQEDKEKDKEIAKLRAEVNTLKKKRK